MSISTTIIPFQFDEEAFKAQIESEVKAGVMDLEALTDLRLMVLETMQSVTVASDNFSDIFSDADGYLNSVVTASTTSTYDNTNKFYFNPLVLDYNTFDVTTGNGDIIEVKAKKAIRINTITFKAAASGTTVLYVYKNDSLFTQIASASYTADNFYTKNVNVDLDVGDKLAISASIVNFWRTVNTIPLNDYFELSSHPQWTPSETTTLNISDSSSGSEKEIVLTYNKAKPKSLYFVAFSGVSTSTEVGDLTIELLKDATSLGVFNAFEIYNDLTLADTPNKLIIKQADTSASKIKKFCLLVD